MKRKTMMRTRQYIIAAIILVAGLGSAALIYQGAGDEPDNGLGYEITDSKMYRHDLELYGGKLNLLTDEFTRWFAGLWHGRSLALIVASITVIASFGFFLSARRLTSGKKTGV